MKTLLSLVVVQWCLATAAWSQTPAAKVPAKPAADYVVVAGEGLQHPVLVAYRADLTLSAAVATAHGGVWNDNGVGFVDLIREGKREKISLKAMRTDSSKDSMLQPWDILYFPPLLF